jgi:hypothetical protein
MELGISNFLGGMYAEGEGTPVPQPYSVAISFGSATKPFSVTNWNLAHTNDPNDTYGLTDMVRLDTGAAITGFNLDIVTAFSDQATGGSANAGTEGASIFPANSARDYWYPASGSRSFNLVVPGGGLGTATVTILSNVTIGTPPHQTIISVGGVEMQLADSSGTVLDDDNVLTWTNVNFDANVAVVITDGTGISAINAMIITFNND